MLTFHQEGKKCNSDSYPKPIIKTFKFKFMWGSRKPNLTDNSEHQKLNVHFNVT